MPNSLQKFLQNPAIPPIIHQIIADYPQFTFKIGQKFTFRPPKTIIFGPPCPYFALLTLHELGHALSGHYDYSTHIKLLTLELEAWEVARQLAKHYQIPFETEVVEVHLDSYRDYLHQTSLCPHCGSNRLQIDQNTFKCPNCDLIQ